MKRLLFSCSVLLLTGLYLGYFISPAAWTFLILAAFAAGVIKAVTSCGIYIKISALFLSLSFICGLFLIPACDSLHSSGPTPGEQVTLKLRVTEEPEISADYCSYICDVISICEEDRENKTDGKIRLFVSSGENLLAFGDVFTAECKITKPKEPLNRGDFDYGLYLKTKGIFLNGSFTNESVSIISGKSYSIKDRFKLLNKRLCQSIDEAFAEDDALLLKAVLLGEKADMPAEFYSSLKRSGLSHVAAVSGMHLSCIIMILVAFCRLLKIRKRIFSVFIIIFSVGFMLLTGMSPSIVRATIMVCCVFAGNILLRRSDSLTALGVAAMIIVLSNPYEAFSTGFILSFSATAGILIFAPPIEKLMIWGSLSESSKLHVKALRYLISLVIVSFSAQLFTIPISFVIFNELSLWTIPANLFIAPVLPLILGAGFLFCLFDLFYVPLAALIAKGLSALTAVARGIISLFASMDFGMLSFGTPDAIHILIYFLALAILFLFLYKKRAYICFVSAMLLIAICFAFSGNIYKSSVANVSFINVGQGDAALITLLGDINILIDGGNPPTDEDSDSSLSTVSSYLSRKGIRNIDFMVATHANSDHIGGLVSVMECYDVDMLLIPPFFKEGELAEKLIKAANNNGTNVRVLKTSDSISFAPEISLEALLPDDYLAENGSDNNSSLVLRLDCFKTSFLFMGDLEASAERYMIKLLSDKALDADVLKVGHHGSKTSTTEELLKKVTPEFAFISVGENSFGHPSEEVLSRLEAVGATVFRSDMNKDVIFILTTEGISNIIYS